MRMQYIPIKLRTQRSSQHTLLIGMIMGNIPFPVFLIAIAQGLGMISAPLVIFAGGFLGVALAPSPALATFPLAVMILGTAVASMPAAMIMQKIGRRSGFIYATLLGILGSILAFFSIRQGNFWGLSFSISLLGMHMAFVQQFRFAALEWVKPEQAATTASIILLGGLFAAWFGPELAMLGKDLFSHTFAGAFVLLAVCHSLLLILLSLIPFVRIDSTVTNQQGRSARELLSDKGMMAAVVCSAVAYGVMSLIMTATPVSMSKIELYPLSETKTVIQSHIMAMFLPSLFTPFILGFLTTFRILLIGISIFIVAISIAIFDQSYWGYWSALVCLGLGWNLMFVGGTTLLAQSYAAAERFKAQAVNEIIVFGGQAIMALSAGWLIFNVGWFGLNLVAIPLLMLALVILARWRIHKT